MLQRLGCRDLEQLLQECVPAEILIDADQARDALPQECDERQALRELEQRAANSASLADELSTLLETLGIEDARTHLTQLAQQLRHGGTT